MSQNYCEGVEPPEPLPDLSAREISLEDDEIVVFTCNAGSPIDVWIEYRLLVTRNEEILYDSIRFRSGYGLGCDSSIRLSISSFGLVSDDIIEVTFEWDPNNNIVELNEGNNIISEIFILNGS